MASTNGKLSEYHAAVALAELDGWHRKQDAIAHVIDTYRHHFEAAGLGDRLIAPPHVCSTYVIFRCEDGAESKHVRGRLESGGVGYRLWYGRGLHHHTYFRRVGRARCSVTDELAPRLIGLPFAPDLSEPTIAAVVATVAGGVAR